MNKILIDRAVVEQTLEALWTSATPKSEDAITALRAALAEPDIDPVDEYRKGFIDGQIDMRDRPAEPVQEPVAGVVLNEEGRAALVEHGREEWHCVVRNARRLYTAPPQRPAEPVAYSVGRTLHWHEGKGVNDAQLYLAPPQRNPVEWDGRCMLGHCNSPAGCENSGECRAVERAHGIGGEE